MVNLGASHLDGLPDELREVVDEHWGNFPPQHPMIVDMFGILFFFLWVSCFLANMGVLYVFFTDKELRTPVSRNHNKHKPLYTIYIHMISTVGKLVHN